MAAPGAEDIDVKILGGCQTCHAMDAMCFPVQEGGCRTTSAVCREGSEPSHKAASWHHPSVVPRPRTFVLMSPIFPFSVSDTQGKQNTATLYQSLGRRGQVRTDPGEGRLLEGKAWREWAEWPEREWSVIS
jgi:hypothetical protein